MSKYRVVEKKNENAVHCICDTEERAKHWIEVKAPEYIEKGYFIDKSLTINSFKILVKES